MNKIKSLPMLSRLATVFPIKSSKRGACQEIIDYDPDLTKLPILHCWPKDSWARMDYPSMFGGIILLATLGLLLFLILDALEAKAQRWK